MIGSLYALKSANSAVFKAVLAALPQDISVNLEGALAILSGKTQVSNKTAVRAALQTLAFIATPRVLGAELTLQVLDAVGIVVTPQLGAQYDSMIGEAKDKLGIDLNVVVVGRVPGNKGEVGTLDQFITFTFDAEGRLTVIISADVLAKQTDLTHFFVNMLGHEYLEASGLSHNQVEALGFKDNTDLSVEELIKIFKTLKSIADSRAALNDLENISEDPLLSIKSAREVLGKIRTIQALNQGWVTMQGKGIFKIKNGTVYLVNDQGDKLDLTSQAQEIQKIINSIQPEQIADLITSGDFGIKIAARLVKINPEFLKDHNLNALVNKAIEKETKGQVSALAPVSAIESMVQFLSQIKPALAPKLQTAVAEAIDALQQEPLSDFRAVHKKIKEKFGETEEEVAFAIIKIPGLKNPIVFILGKGTETSVGVSAVLLKIISLVPGIQFGHTHPDSPMPTARDVINIIQLNLTDGKRKASFILGKDQMAVIQVKTNKEDVYQSQVTVTYYENLENPRIIKLETINLAQTIAAELLFSVYKKSEKVLDLTKNLGKAPTALDFFAQLLKDRPALKDQMDEFKMAIDLQEFLKQDAQINAWIRNSRNPLAQTIGVAQYLFLIKDMPFEEIRELLAFLGLKLDGLDKETFEQGIRELENFIKDQKAFGKEFLDKERREKVKDEISELLPYNPAEDKSAQAAAEKTMNLLNNKTLDGVDSLSLEVLLHALFKAPIWNQGENLADAFSRVQGIKGNGNKVKEAAIRVIPQAEWLSQAKQSMKDAKGFYDPQTNTIYIRLDKGMTPLETIAIALHEEVHAYLPENVPNNSTTAEFLAIIHLAKALESQAQNPGVKLLTAQLKLDLLRKLNENKITNRPVETKMVKELKRVQQGTNTIQTFVVTPFQLPVVLPLAEELMQDGRKVEIELINDESLFSQKDLESIIGATDNKFAMRIRNVKFDQKKGKFSIEDLARNMDDLLNTNRELILVGGKALWDNPDALKSIASLKGITITIMEITFSADSEIGQWIEGIINSLSNLTEAQKKDLIHELKTKKLDPKVLNKVDLDHEIETVVAVQQ